MKKALFVVGPTAIGKTDLAIKVAEQYPFELISADSVQVYRGCDIVSGKDHPKDRNIHLIDINAPFDPYSVSDFSKDASLAIREIEKNKKIPLIVGGTGFYVESLFKEIETVNIPPDNNLRGRLEKKSVPELQEQLEKINEERFSKMNESDVKNPRRLIRAIEVSLYKKEGEKMLPVFDPEDVLIIGLKMGPKKLKKRIEERVEKRLEMGALFEAKKLFDNYSDLAPNIKRANGYRQLFAYLAGELAFGEVREKWVTADYQHSKKQMTWFRKNPDIHWFDIEKKGYQSGISKLIVQNFSSI